MDRLCGLKDWFFSTTLGKIIKLGLSIYMIVDIMTDAINTKKFSDYATGCN